MKKKQGKIHLAVYMGASLITKVCMRGDIQILVQAIYNTVWNQVITLIFEKNSDMKFF